MTLYDHPGAEHRWCWRFCEAFWRHSAISLEKTQHRESSGGILDVLACLSEGVSCPCGPTSARPAPPPRRGNACSRPLLHLAHSINPESDRSPPQTSYSPVNHPPHPSPTFVYARRARFPNKARADWCGGDAVFAPNMASHWVKLAKALSFILSHVQCLHLWVG